MTTPTFAEALKTANLLDKATYEALTRRAMDLTAPKLTLTIATMFLEALDETRRTAKQLDAQAERIARDMKCLRLGLAERGQGAGFNSLGEIQGSGAELDRLCGELDARRRMLGRIAVALDTAVAA